MTNLITPEAYAAAQEIYHSERMLDRDHETNIRRIALIVMNHVTPAHPAVQKLADALQEFLAAMAKGQL